VPCDQLTIHSITSILVSQLKYII